jgi:HSP20 family protein
MATITKKEKAQPRAVRAYDSNVAPSSTLDRFLDDTFDPFSMLAPSLLSGRLGEVRNTFPKVDMKETDKEIMVTANLPGIAPEEIDIEVGDDYVALSGTIEKENTEEDDGGKVYRYEREFGQFRRVFSLPAHVRPDSVAATVENGVLTITLPKAGDEHKAKVRAQAK